MRNPTSLVCSIVILSFIPHAIAEPKSPPKVIVHGCDGSVIQLTILDNKLHLQTPHGLLTVPLHKVTGIELATRVPAEIQKRIDAAIIALGSRNFRERDAAEQTLLQLEERAVEALQKATDAADVEVARRASGILDKLKEMMDEERLTVRKQDIIYTKEAKLVGSLTTPFLSVRTRLFGEQKVNIGDLYLVDFGTEIVKGSSAKATPDPGSLVSLQNQIGSKFRFTVTGAANGSVWGTDLYTTDSTLAAVAVHAGALKAGETGIVEVTIHPSPPGFQGTTRNGITSSVWGVYTAAYSVKQVKGRR